MQGTRELRALILLNLLQDAEHYPHQTEEELKEGEEPDEEGEASTKLDTKCATL